MDKLRKIKLSALAAGLAAAMLLAARSPASAVAGAITLNMADADGAAPGIQVRAGEYLPSGATFYYVAGSSGIWQGGQIRISIPNTWSYPQTEVPGSMGYVTAVSTSAAAFNVSVLSTQTVNIIIVEISTSGPRLQAGQAVVIHWSDIYASYAVQTGAVLMTRVRLTANEALRDLSVQPTVDIIPGPPARVVFEQMGMTVLKSSPTAVRLAVVDNNWIVTSATFPVTVHLKGKSSHWDSVAMQYPDDFTAVFSTMPTMVPTTNIVAVAPGQSRKDFYYQTSTSPYAVVEITSTLDTSGMSQTLWVNVVSGGITASSLAGAGVAAGGKTAVMAAGENLYINFAVSDENTGWQVIVSTSPSRDSAIWNYYGWGVPGYNQVSWNGRYSYWDNLANVWRDGLVANGTYYIRIQLGYGGGIKDDTLSASVMSLNISGRVTEAGTSDPVAGAYVSAWGPSYSWTTTDSNGNYVLAGLRAGYYFIDINAAGYTRTYMSDVPAGSTSADAVLKQPAFIKINAQREIAEFVGAPEAWGGARIQSASGNVSPYWGSLHFAVGVSTSDNGQWGAMSNAYETDNGTSVWSPGKWTVAEVESGTYTVTAELWGYSSVSTAVFVASGQAVEALLYIPAKKIVTGVVKLPAETQSYSWVSVEGIKQGDAWGSAWGWANIDIGMSSAPYTIYGADAGNYTLRAHAPGFKRSTVAVSVSAATSVTAAPDIILAEGGVLRGTVTVEGDTTGTNISRVWLNAWSPETFAYGYAEVPIEQHAVSASSTFTIKGLEDGTYWLNSWVQGFDMEGSFGWMGLRGEVKNGEGVLNIKFKKHSGVVNVVIKAPSNDYANVYLDIDGAGFWQSNIRPAELPQSGDITFSSATGAGILRISGLGTGFFRVRGEYRPAGMTSGPRKDVNVMAVNGETKEALLNLDVPFSAVSGTFRINTANPPQGHNGPGVSSIYAALASPENDFKMKIIDYAKMKSLASSTGGMIMEETSAPIAHTGTYTVTGLAPGVYIFYLPPLNLDNDSMNGRETAVSEKLVVVGSAPLSGVDMEISRGYSLRGRVRLPAGDYYSSGYEIRIKRAATGLPYNFLDSAIMSPNSAYSDEIEGAYELKNIAPGDYILSVYDYSYPRKYAAASLAVKVSAADADSNGNINGKDLRFARGGTIKLKLRDADSGTVITPKNRSTMLKSAYQITAAANPWMDGGWGWDESMNTDEAFIMRNLPAGTYDVVLGQSSYGFMPAVGGAMSASSQTDYASKVISGVKIERGGDVVDLGAIDIKQGLTVSGTILDRSGRGIPNIPVVALPSLSNEWKSELRGFTDINGKYSISGLNSDNQYYDIIAAPRVDPNLFTGFHFFWGQGGVSYGERVRQMVKVSQTPQVNFVLDEARGSVSGKLVTEDGGVLGNPSDANLPTARIYMQRENTFPRTNTVGDIVADTDVDGNFSIAALAPGNYRFTAISAGYGSHSRTVAVGTSAVNTGNITLARGARIAGKITKPGDVYPSISEVRGIVSVSDDLSEFLVGTLKMAGEKTVTGYELYGFGKGSSYNIMFVTEGDELVPAKIGYTVPFSSYTKTDEDLEFRISAPAVMARARRSSGNVFTVNFELTGALDETDSAENLAALVTKTAGQGTLSDLYMSPSKKILSARYTAPASENRFAVRLRASARNINNVRQPFPVDETFDFYAGIAAANKVRVSNMRGGRVTLEGDSSSVVFSADTFEGASSTSTLDIQFMRGDDPSELSLARDAAQGAPRFTIPRPAAAYPGHMHKAMSVMRSAAVSPLSSFYDVFLPKGVSRALKKDARLTIEYSTASVAPGDSPDDYNVYYFDELNNVWLLENRGKVVDEEAGTVTVSIGHTSIFALIKSAAPVIAGAADVAAMFVYNFPNPFNLAVKDVILANSSPSGEKKNISGTMIHFGLPAGVSGDAEIRIYNVAGELVRAIKGAGSGMNSLAANRHYYVEWDGKNDHGRVVASGVYVGRLTVDGKNEKFFKMALIK